MKRLNKKGFTLVELLVVLVILVVIMSIAIPSITSSLERSKEKQKDATIKLIVSAAELYVDSHKNTYADCKSSNICRISIKDLISNGLLSKEESKDPFNDNKTLCGWVTYDGVNYDWDEDENNNECESIG